MSSNAKNVAAQLPADRSDQLQALPASYYIDEAVLAREKEHTSKLNEEGWCANMEGDFFGM